MDLFCSFFRADDRVEKENKGADCTFTIYRGEDMDFPRITLLFQKIMGFKSSSLYSNHGRKGIPYNRETNGNKKTHKLVEYLYMRIYIFLSTWKGNPFGPLSHTELIVDYWLMKTVNINRRTTKQILKVLCVYFSLLFSNANTVRTSSRKIIKMRHLRVSLNFL